MTNQPPDTSGALGEAKLDELLFHFYIMRGASGDELDHMLTLIKGAAMRNDIAKIERLSERVRKFLQAREREAEKRAETRWKREHDYWKQLAETFLKRDQLRPPEPMYTCNNLVCSSLHTAEQLQQLTKPQAGDGEGAV